MSLMYKLVITFLVSMVPIIELRVGVPIATGMGIDWYIALPVAIIGNIIPVPFILLFVREILDCIDRCDFDFLNKIAKWLHKKVDKNKSSIEKYGYLGLILFVGIPLPGTGAWTGCLIAAVLNMNRRKSFFAIMTGIIMASVIMMAISYGIVGNLIQ